MVEITWRDRGNFNIYATFSIANKKEIQVWKVRQAARRETWTFENVSVKKSGARAYIIDAAGTVLRKKPIQNITIVPKAGATNTS